MSPNTLHTATITDSHFWIIFYSRGNVLFQERIRAIEIWKAHFHKQDTTPFVPNETASCLKAWKACHLETENIPAFRLRIFCPSLSRWLGNEDVRLHEHISALRSYPKDAITKDLLNKWINAKHVLRYKWTPVRGSTIKSTVTILLAFFNFTPQLCWILRSDHKWVVDSFSITAAQTVVQAVLQIRILVCSFYNTLLFL